MNEKFTAIWCIINDHYNSIMNLLFDIRNLAKWIHLNFQLESYHLSNSFFIISLCLCSSENNDETKQRKPSILRWLYSFSRIIDIELTNSVKTYDSVQTK